MQLQEVLFHNLPAIEGTFKVKKYEFDAQEVEDLLRYESPSTCFKIIKNIGSRKLRLKPIWGKSETAKMVEDTPPEEVGFEIAPIELGFDSPSEKAVIESTPVEVGLEVAPEDPSPFRAGQLDYEIPDVMQLNQPVMCTIRLAGTEVAPEAIRISGESIHAAIQITNEMSVRLVDISNGANFGIASISSERQAISRGDFTEWKISVTPLKAGTFSLFLRISAHFDGKTQDMEVLEKSIRVNGDASRTLEQIASQIQKKIVFLAADAKSGLLLGRESNKIREELLMSTHRDDFLYTTLFEVTGLDFSRTLLREKPAIVHFSGHGSSQGIFLVNQREVPQLAPTDALKKLFGVLQKILKIECVILNACFSKTQAEVVAQSIPVVVGTQSKIGDNEAINFSIGFYQGLGEGLLYDDAFELGRVQVSFNSDDEDAEEVLVLLKKSL